MSPTRSARNSNTGLIGLYTQSVDVTDVQVFAPVDASKFPPDKAATWSIPTEHDNLVLMHNAIRAEVTKFEALLFKLGARQLKRWEKDLIKVSSDARLEHTFHTRDRLERGGQTNSRRKKTLLASFHVDHLDRTPS